MKALRYLVLLSVLAAPLAASTVLKLNFTQLSRAAHQVVAGQIIDITPEKDPATGYIYSRVTLSVSQAIPATLVGRSYTFNMVGGVMNGKRLHIAGFPNLERDQKVILFLNNQRRLSSDRRPGFGRASSSSGKTARVARKWSPTTRVTPSCPSRIIG